MTNTKVIQIWHDFGKLQKWRLISKGVFWQNHASAGAGAAASGLSDFGEGGAAQYFRGHSGKLGDDGIAGGGFGRGDRTRLDDSSWSGAICVMQRQLLG